MICSLHGWRGNMQTIDIRAEFGYGRAMELVTGFIRDGFSVKSRTEGNLWIIEGSKEREKDEEPT